MFRSIFEFLCLVFFPAFTMDSANVGALIASGIESSGVTLKLNSEITIKLRHENELLQRPFSVLLRGYLPVGSVVPLDKDHL